MDTPLPNLASLKVFLMSRVFFLAFMCNIPAPSRPAEKILLPIFFWGSPIVSSALACPQL